MRDRLGIRNDHDGAVWFTPQRPKGSRKAGWYRHTHDELEADLIITGHATYRIVGSDVRVERGSLAWLFPDQDHQLLDLSADFRHIITVWRQRAVIVPDLVGTAPAEIMIRTLADRDLHLITEMARDLAGQENPLLGYGLRYLQVRMWRAFQEASRRGGDHPAVAAALDLLSDGNHSVTALAAEAGVSADHLRRLIRQRTGSTIVALRQRQCLERFFAEFSDEDSLATVAEVAGFGSYPQFLRVFRRHVGCAPRAWLSALRRGEARRYPLD